MYDNYWYIDNNQIIVDISIYQYTIIYQLL